MCRDAAERALVVIAAVWYSVSLSNVAATPCRLLPTFWYVCVADLDFAPGTGVARAVDTALDACSAPFSGSAMTVSTSPFSGVAISLLFRLASGSTFFFFASASPFFEAAAAALGLGAAFSLPAVAAAFLGAALGFAGLTMEKLSSPASDMA